MAVVRRVRSRCRRGRGARIYIHGGGGGDCGTVAASIVAFIPILIVVPSKGELAAGGIGALLLLFRRLGGRRAALGQLARRGGQRRIRGRVWRAGGANLPVLGRRGGRRRRGGGGVTLLLLESLRATLAEVGEVDEADGVGLQ